MVCQTLLLSDLSVSASPMMFRISFQNSSLSLGRLFGSASQQRSASFLYLSGAESGIVGRSPPTMSHAKSLSNNRSLKGGSPVATKYIIIPKEYISDALVNLRVLKTSGAIKGKTPPIFELDSDLVERERPRSQMYGWLKNGFA